MREKPENNIAYYVAAIESLQYVLGLTGKSSETHFTLERPPLIANIGDYKDGYYFYEDYIKNCLKNQITFKMLILKGAINKIATSFALEHTKFSHRFPYVDSNNYQTKEMNEKAKKTYKLLYQNKVNQLVESLPDFIDKDFFTTIYE